MGSSITAADYSIVASKAHRTTLSVLRTPWMKLLVLVALPISACIGAYFVVQSPFYEQYADPLWIRASSQIYQTSNSTCQVVIYGDSTAITGLDPEVIAKATNLSTCNVAQTKGTLVTLGTQGLDMFLHHNPRPKVLLLQFSGSDFYHAHSWGDTIGYMEGGIPLLRYYPRRDFMMTLGKHPELLIGLMRYAYVSGPVNWWRNRTAQRVLPHSSDTPVNVHFVRPGPGFTNCDHSEDIDPVFHRPDPSFIAWLRQHYGEMADRVIIDVAPTSACNPHAGYLQNSLSGLDNSLLLYPISDFNEGYVHFTAKGAFDLSQQVAVQVEEKLSQSGAPVRSYPEIGAFE